MNGLDELGKGSSHSSHFISALMFAKKRADYKRQPLLRDCERITAEEALSGLAVRRHVGVKAIWSL